MISELSLYLITRCDPVGKVLLALAIISGILMVVILIGNIMAFCCQDEDKSCAEALPKIRKSRNWLASIFVACCCCTGSHNQGNGVYHRRSQDCQQ